MKRAVSFVLAIAMVLALFPVFNLSASAATQNGTFFIFDTNGVESSYTSPVCSYVKDLNSYLQPPFAPTSEDYDFAGWYLDKECTHMWNFNLTVAANIAGYYYIPSQIILFAKWVPKNSGNITNITIPELNYGKANLADFTNLSAFFTENELINIASGKKAAVWLSVKEDETLSLKYDFKLAKNISVKFLTIEMFKCIGDLKNENVLKVTDIPSGEKVSVKLQIPENFRGSEAYSVVHFLKDGKYEILESEYDAKNAQLIFETDSFSNFAIVNTEIKAYADYRKISVSGKNVTVDVPAFAEPGEVVALTVTPDKYYDLDKLYIIIDGTYKSVVYQKFGDGKFVFVMPDGNVTIYASGAEVKYPIDVKTEKAVVSVGVSAIPGAEAKFKVTPDAGYAIDKLTVTTASGKTVTYKDLGNGEYSFTMPAEKVEIAVVCKIPEIELPFVDVDKTSDIYDDVKFVYENGLMVGVDAYNFGVNEAITRGMIVTILWRLEGSPEPAGVSKFSDVVDGAYYEKAVIWAHANGIVAGYDDGTFAPGKNITRDQLACILYRYAQYKGEGFTGAWMYLLPFEDKDKVRDWAYESIAWCYMNGVMKERKEGTFAPKETATRGDTAQALAGLCEILDK